MFGVGLVELGVVLGIVALLVVVVRVALGRAPQRR